MKNFYSIESEQIVLGCLIIYNYSWYEVYRFLTIDSFYFDNHKLIFSLILEFLNSNINFDVISIHNRVRYNFNFDYLNYLNYLIQKIPNPSSVLFHSFIIHNMYILRKIITLISNFSKLALNSKFLNLNNLINDMEYNLFDINKSYFKNKNNFNLIGDILRNYFNNNLLSKNDLFFTGFKNIDDILLGIHRGDFFIVAGRPSTGKTAFSLNILKHVSEFYNLPVIFFSMEMSVEQLFVRILGLILDKEQNIIINDLKNKNFNYDFLYEKINSLKIFIDDSSDISILHIYSRCKLLIKEYGDLGLVIIDYLQLMNSFNNSQNRVFEISEISRSLKCLAKELNIPLIVISQLNRNLELRSNKRPLISDLRESGSIEQDADIILFIYKDSIYNKKNNDNLVEIIISKHRNGFTGNVFLNFSEKKLKFFC